jgi:hypothetical protein
MNRRASIVDFLEHKPGESFCDACLALAMRLSLLEVRALLAGGVDPAARRPGTCGVCGRTLDVTSVPAR